MLAATLGVRGAAGATATEKQKSWAGRCPVAACARRAPPPAPGPAWLGDSTLMAWYSCLYAPRTGGAYDSHHRTAGVAGRTRRRGGGVAARGAGAADGDAGGRISQPP